MNWKSTTHFKLHFCPSWHVIFKSKVSLRPNNNVYVQSQQFCRNYSLEASCECLIDDNFVIDGLWMLNCLGTGKFTQCVRIWMIYHDTENSTWNQCTGIWIMNCVWQPCSYWWIFIIWHVFDGFLNLFWLVDAFTVFTLFWNPVFCGLLTFYQVFTSPRSFCGNIETKANYTVAKV